MELRAFLPHHNSAAIALLHADVKAVFVHNAARRDSAISAGKIAPRSLELRATLTTASAAVIGGERFCPPMVAVIAATLSLHETEVRQLLKALAAMSKVDEIAADHVFLRTTVAEMVGRNHRRGASFC